MVLSNVIGTTCCHGLIFVQDTDIEYIDEYMAKNL